MPRYIDADALYKETEKKIKEANSYRMAVVDSEFLDLIDDADTADVVQRAEYEKLQEVNADLNESLRLAAEANKDMKIELDAMRGAANSLKIHYENARAEAIKEFAERLKETPIELGLPLLGLLTKSEIEDYFNHTLLQVRDAINNLVAEMTEGE